VCKAPLSRVAATSSSQDVQPGAHRSQRCDRAAAAQDHQGTLTQSTCIRSGRCMQHAMLLHLIPFFPSPLTPHPSPPTTTTPQVKNKQPSDRQITAEQILREAKEIQLEDDFKAPKTIITGAGLRKKGACIRRPLGVSHLLVAERLCGCVC